MTLGSLDPVEITPHGTERGKLGKERVWGGFVSGSGPAARLKSCPDEGGRRSLGSFCFWGGLYVGVEAPTPCHRRCSQSASLRTGCGCPLS